MRNTEMARFQVLAVNDKKDFCECCGRKGLKKVVWVWDSELDLEKHFGTSCAQSPEKGFDPAEIKKAVKKFKDEEGRRHSMAYAEYRRQGGKYIAHKDKAGTWVPASPDMYAKCLESMTA
jgi:hypothetical protein